MADSSTGVIDATLLNPAEADERTEPCGRWVGGNCVASDVDRIARIRILQQKHNTIAAVHIDSAVAVGIEQQFGA